MSYKIVYELPEKPFEVTPPPAPVVGSQVFGTDGDDWHLNASMGYVHSEWKWDWYADGYKKAGDLLVEFVAATQSHQDILVFPVVFNYRQYLELRLKELLMLCSYYLDHKFELPTHHDLKKLWEQLLPKLQQLDKETNWDGVGYVILEFHKTDIGSFAFRYPVLKDGSSPSLSGITGINLGVVRDRIEEVARLLDGMSAGVSEYLTQKREYESEMRAEAAAYEREATPDYGGGEY
jgi:hypothetical protein